MELGLHVNPVSTGDFSDGLKSRFNGTSGGSDTAVKFLLETRVDVEGLAHEGVSVSHSRDGGKKTSSGEGLHKKDSLKNIYY
jgi:hypothetical protein